MGLDEAVAQERIVKLHSLKTHDKQWNMLFLDIRVMLHYSEVRGE
jgi:hypothetical protein